MCRERQGGEWTRARKRQCRTAPLFDVPQSAQTEEKGIASLLLRCQEYKSTLKMIFK